MKILFIGTKKYDYLQDLTYSGLTKVLGRGSVIELNPVTRYHLPIKTYPKNLGYTGFNPVGLCNRSYKQVDCVVVAAAKPACFEAYERTFPFLSSSVKTVFVDGGDWSDIGGDFKRLKQEEAFLRVMAKRPFDVIFKREYLIDVDYPSNVHPLPFSFNENHYKGITQHPYKYDVAFWAVESHPIRTSVFNYLSNRFDCASNGTIPNLSANTYQRKGRFYFEEIKRTRISLNFRGTGWDTLRFWEVLGLGGFMISQRPGIVIPNAFEEGIDTVYCQDDLSDLESLCTYYLKHEDQRQCIANKARQRVLAHHTDVARAMYILERL